MEKDNNLTIDNRVLTQLKLGKESALQVLFEKYYPYMVSVAFNYLSDEHSSKDLAQEVFLDLWKRRESVDIKFSLKAYLRKAIIFKCITFLKRKKNTASLLNEKIDFKSTDADIEENYLLSELEDVIKATIENLPEKCKLVFIKSRYENLSHKEISEELLISSKTIENHITKALSVLRQSLKKYGALSTLTLILTIINH